MPANPKKEREDSQRNGVLVQKAMLAFIKKHLRPPSRAELVAITGLSGKTVALHRQRVKLGDGKDNVYQQLTNDVIMALHARAVGYEHPAVKIFNDKFAGIVEADYTEHYPPDAAAAKLWMQVVEGFSEKSEQKHSGEVAVKMTFNYMAPAAPDSPTPPDAGN